MPVYRSSAHARYDCRYHIVWIPKYRKKILIGKIKERVIDLINQRSESLKVLVLKGSIEPDHIHLYVSMPPSLSVSKYVNYIKGMTSRMLRIEFTDELKTHYWKPVLWADGYFAATVGEISDELIRNYIAKQETREKEEINQEEVWNTTQEPPDLKAGE